MADKFVHPVDFNIQQELRRQIDEMPITPESAFKNMHLINRLESMQVENWREARLKTEKAEQGTIIQNAEASRSIVSDRASYGR